MPRPKQEPLKLPPDAEEFLAYLRDERRASEHTLRAYCHDLTVFVEFISSFPHEKSLFSLRSSDIKAFRDNQARLGFSNRTIKRRLAAVKHLFDYLIKEARIAANPVNLVTAPRLPEESRVPAILTQTQIRELFAMQFDSLRDRVVLELLYDEGLTVSELAGLNIEDIDFGKKEIRVASGHNERILPLSSYAEDVLNRYLAEHGASSGPLVQGGYRGKRMNTRDLRRIVNYYLSRIAHAPAVHPYVLRHSFAVHMLQRGAKPEAVRQLLGITTRRSMDKYIRVARQLSKSKETYKRAHPRAEDK